MDALYYVDRALYLLVALLVLRFVIKSAVKAAINAVLDDAQRAFDLEQAQARNISTNRMEDWG